MLDSIDYKINKEYWLCYEQGSDEVEGGIETKSCTHTSAFIINYNKKNHNIIIKIFFVPILAQEKKMKKN